MKDYLGYAEKKCVVIGGSSGMGKACTEMLLDLGAEVYVLDIMPCDVPGVTFYEADLQDREGLKAVFEKLPKFDKFFGWAGVSGKFEKGAMVAINILSYMYILDELLYDKMNEHGAALFNVSIAGEGWESSYEKYKYFFEHSYEESIEWARNEAKGSVYVLTKQALNYYVVVKHFEKYGEKWIRLNCISPGLTKSRLRQDFVDGYPGPAEDISGTALKRDAEVHDQARAGIAINSDLFGYVAGTITYVDGGHHASSVAKSLR